MTTPNNATLRNDLAALKAKMESKGYTLRELKHRASELVFSRGRYTIEDPTTLRSIEAAASTNTKKKFIFFIAQAIKAINELTARFKIENGSHCKCCRFNEKKYDNLLECITHQSQCVRCNEKSAFESPEEHEAKEQRGRDEIAAKMEAPRTLHFNTGRQYGPDNQPIEAREYGTPYNDMDWWGDNAEDDQYIIFKDQARGICGKINLCRLDKDSIMNAYDAGAYEDMMGFPETDAFHEEELATPTYSDEFRKGYQAAINEQLSLQDISKAVEVPKKAKLWVDWYPSKDRYVVFVAGFAINAKECCPEVANNIAKALGQAYYDEIEHNGPQVIRKVEVY